MHMIHDPQEPMAWAVISKWYAGPVISTDEAAARSLAKGDDTVAPLYPQPTLTDAEQSLIGRLAAECEGGHPREWTNRALTADDRATLRGLLERTQTVGK